MERYLITGGAGFVGAACADWFLTTDPDCLVTVVDRPRRTRPCRLRRLLEAHGERLKVVNIDLASGECGRLVLLDCDVLVNCASYSHVQGSIDWPVTCWSNNVALISNVLEAARHIRPRVFVQVSTDEVYGTAPPGVKFAEWSSILPSNPYAASKAAQEALCCAYWRTYGVPLVLVNAMNMIGEYQHQEKFIPHVVRRLLAHQPVQVHCDPDTGRPGSRNYTHVDNFASAVAFLAGPWCVPAPRWPDADRPARFNVPGQVEVNNEQMVRLIADMLDVGADIEMVDGTGCRPGHDLRYALDGSALALVGWHHPFEFHDALRRTVLFCRDNPEWLEQTPS